MGNIRRIAILMLVAITFSLGAVGCRSTGRHDHADHPASAQPEGDRPKGDHPQH